MMFSESEEEDTKKFSFLLGSSLRNKDEDQFLTLYDAALPANLPKEKVDYIKEKAREISELPDNEYDELVIKASDFSLAPSTKMHPGSGKPPCKSPWSPTSDMDEEESLPSENSSALSSYSLRSTEKSGNKTCSSDDPGYDSLGKAVPSLGNISDSDSESRGGFDYFPTMKSVDKKKCSGTADNSNDGAYFDYYPPKTHDYDEAYEVESSQSSQDITSPRSDISIGKSSLNGCDMEMTTYRSNLQNDFDTDDDSDSEKKIIHQQLYNKPGTFTPMSKENSEDYVTSKLSFERSKEALQGRSTSSLRGRKSADDGILFSPLNYSRQGRENSESVRIEKTTYPRATDPLLGKKTFHRENELRDVGTSTKSFASRTVTEMKPVSQGVGINLDERKKSKSTKDHGEARTADHSKRDTSAAADVDENGNPIDVSSDLSLTLKDYKQMREPPKCNPAVTSTSKNQISYGSTSNVADNFRHDFRYSEPYLHSQQIKDSDDASSSLHDRRKTKKKNKEKVVHSEDVDNYVGNKFKDIDDLVNFIENDGSQKKKKFFSPALSNKHSTKTEKPSRKIKERKLKFSETGSDPPEEEQELVEEPGVNLETSLAPQSNVDTSQALDSSMGNSHGKGEENTEPDGVKKTIENEIQNGANKVGRSALVKNEEVKPRKQKNNKKDVLTESVRRKSLSDVEKKTKSAKDNDSTTKKLNIRKSKENGDVSNSKTELLNTRALPSLDSLKTAEVKAPNKLAREMPSLQVQVQELKNDNSVKLHIMNNSKTDKCLVRQPSNNVMATDLKSDDHDATADEIRSYYIFTDIDIIAPVEHEFTLVSKKKKHIPVSKKELHPPRELPVISRPVHTREKPVTPARSVTPPPYTGIFVAAKEEDRSRDLSPSAFPALRSDSKGRQSSRDGRRNSTGDVPSEMSLKVQDDSDIESVKSLPASQAALGEQPPLPNMPATYAKIAASPKQKEGLQSSIKSNSVSPSGSEDSEASPAIWKGNATERRHSIGSSPDDVRLNAEHASPGSVQTEISQELIMPDSRTAGLANTTVAGIESAQNLPGEGYLGENPLSGVISEATIDSKSPTLESKNCVVVESTMSYGNDVNALPQRVRNRTSRKERTKSPISKTQNNNKKLKTQSVIFCDKRVASVPQNFGISFGFDESAEPQQDRNVRDVHSNTNSDSVKSQKLTANSTVHYNVNVSKAVSLHSVPCSSSNLSSENCEDKVVASTVISNHLLSSKPDSKHVHLTKDGTSKPPTIPRINGVIQPNSHDRPKLVHYHSKAAVDKKQVSNSVTTNANQSSENPGNSGSHKVAPPGVEYVIVEYGNGDLSPIPREKSLSKMPSNGPKQISKKIGFVPESSEHTDRFNHMEAVGFLQRGWEQIMDLKARDPSRVVDYLDQ